MCSFLRTINTAAFNGAAVVNVMGFHYVIVTEMIGTNPFPSPNTHQVILHAQIPVGAPPPMAADAQFGAPQPQVVMMGAPQQGYSPVPAGGAVAPVYAAQPSYGYQPTAPPQNGYYDANAHIPMAEVVVAKPMFGGDNKVYPQ